jgi:sugar phosphate permease
MRLAGKLRLCSWCSAFAAGYYLSYFYRYVNAVIAKDLVHDFALAPGDLGLLTSAYFLAFAAFQLPLACCSTASGRGAAPPR